MFFLWDQLPLAWRFTASFISIVLLGYSISPISMASSIVFRFDQEKSCDQRFHEEIRMAVAISNRNGVIDEVIKNRNACNQAIPSNPSLVDEFFAWQQGRTVLFRKEEK